MFHTTLALHIHISLIKALIFSKSCQTLTVLLIVSVTRPVLDQQLYLVVNLNCMSPKHYFMSLLMNWFYCIKLDIPKPIIHNHDLHWQHFVCDNMAVTCMGKSYRMLKVIYCLHNIMWFNQWATIFNLVLIQSYCTFIHMLPCKCSVC